ncbi:MAG: glutamyl-tRNA(Gln) amidotransferase subunit C [Candidatus Pelagibacterales bacterium]|jgi:aspartyl-tRNA(Asn)/glutamyl-tRNA(Gln) amidotransferase subunit C|nr:MAG: glutamyl-tRNA(Gln) amidotransferase subunit C [Pelagibacterales bacterium]|tara:strand:+ start:42 stop:329 length:288 start_codon:yes stop_codon:yes gene_type:complete
MEFDKKSLLKLGKLARISISDDKLNNLSKDLNSILEFVDQLKEIKTDQVDPTSNSLNQKLEVRDDKVDTKNSAEDILENAPEKEMDFFVVPKVIE